MVLTCYGYTDPCRLMRHVRASERVCACVNNVPVSGILLYSVVVRFVARSNYMIGTVLYRKNAPSCGPAGVILLTCPAIDRLLLLVNFNLQGVPYCKTVTVICPVFLPVEFVIV